MEFVERLNDCTTYIKFTIHCDAVSIPFLDVMVKNTTEGCLDTDLFVKNTDRNTLLRYDSFHPPHIKKSLPKAQFLRVKRIVKHQQQRDVRISEMKEKFKIRGYPDRVLDRMESENRLLGQISDRVAETIGTKLVKADLGASAGYKQTFLKKQKNGTYPCCGCNHCSSVVKGEWIHHPLKWTRIPIKGFYTCASTYVVYSLKCPCGKIYVGKTIRCIRDRLTEHKSAIRNKLNQPVAKHFNENGHTISQLRFQILDSVSKRRRGGDRGKELLRKEAHWIKKLGTMSPQGLNQEYDLSPFLFK
ncbi:hypothetical protein XELAEV_18031145mg [Xenopus laevis]|uniref:GIY-YIG domain-containing protein n=1 Tax=Xenopus laevis TaxID=8355 RepID=A0A974CM21_XENLA|nr:hypothetical protein XELAEV_18031145mg [Xenopus laevis]